MKITLKTLQGKQLPMEIEPDITIEALKDAIAEQHAMPAESQNLVAYGKVLAEASKTVTEYNIKDGDFIVVMVKKAKVVKAAPAKPTAPVEQPKAEEPKPEEVQPSSAGGAEAGNGAAEVQPVQPSAQPVQPAQPTGPPVDPDQVATLVTITGKDPELCTKALQAAFGDADRAFSYLTEGIPQQPAGPGAGAYGGMEEEGSYEGEGAAGDQPGLATMMEMANNPNFPQLRARILQNPAFYQEFMTMLQETQPHMHAAINANPQAFMQLILGGQVGAGGAGAGAGQPRPAGGAPGQQPGTISVSQTEMEAIQRLETLGFNRNRCVQAYFACDKNEEFAANFLFEQAAEDDDDALNQGVAQSSAPVNVPQVEPTAPVENQPMAEDKPAEEQPKPEEGAGASEAQQNPQPEANNNNGGNGDNEPDAGAGAGGDAPEKSAFE